VERLISQCYATTTAAGAAVLLEKLLGVSPAVAAARLYSPRGLAGSLRRLKK
jgi:hypothetical protein